MSQNTLFTSGNIASRLVRFAVPVLGALFLQSFYGAVDLLIVGQFGSAADVSAVATGTMMMQTITFIITGLAMGTTIQMAQALGAKDNKRAADIIGTSILFFLWQALPCRFHSYRQELLFLIIEGNDPARCIGQLFLCQYKFYQLSVKKLQDI